MPLVDRSDLAMALREIQDTACGGRKIDAIKQYRDITFCGLKEAKDAVEALMVLDEKDVPTSAQLVPIVDVRVKTGEGFSNVSLVNYCVSKVCVELSIDGYTYRLIRNGHIVAMGIPSHSDALRMAAALNS